MSKGPEEKRRLTINCPCCSAVLTIDPNTGLVLKSKEKAPDYSLEEALRHEKDRKAQADALFDKAFQDEKRRHDSLEEKFREALNSKDELEDPKRPWDFGD